MRKDRVYPYRKTMKFNNNIWLIIKKWLFLYESKVRHLIDEHGMDTKYEDESALF